MQKGIKSIGHNLNNYDDKLSGFIIKPQTREL